MKPTGWDMVCREYKFKVRSSKFKVAGSTLESGGFLQIPRTGAAWRVAWLLTLPAVLAGQAPRAMPGDVGLNPVPLGEATALLGQFVADGKIAGAVAAVARQGRVACLEAVGVQDLDTNAPMTPRSVFRIYSMTKSVTAVAVMMLHQEGKFRLDDPVSVHPGVSRTCA